MRFNWGHGIFIVIILIVVGFSTVLVMSFGKNYELVATDYYAQEVAFQDQLDKENRRIKDHKQISYKMVNNHFVIQFDTTDAALATGAISFLRPSNKMLDFTSKLALDEKGKQLIPVDTFEKGAYSLAIDWEVGGEKYFFKENIYIK